MNWIKIKEGLDLNSTQRYVLYGGEMDYVAVRWSAHYKAPVCLVSGQLLTLEYFTYYSIITPPNELDKDNT